MIKLKWGDNHRGSPMFQWVKKLQACQDGLRVWSKEHFGNNIIQITHLKSELVALQIQPVSEHNLSLRSQIKSDLELLLAREEMFLHQRWRVRWLNYGDKNSSFFHASMVQRRQRNQIIQLQSEDGTWLNTYSED